MLQSQFGVTVQKVKMNHSRKELIQWIAKEANDHEKTLAASFNPNLLKNGVFFLSILQKVFPEESTSIKTKMKQKPVSEYDLEKNVTLIKKTLQKYNLQYNLDVHEIIKNKGCFDLLNWMKNLNDGLISIPTSESNSSHQVSTSKMNSPMKKSLLAHSGYKTIREGSSGKSGQKPHSQAKTSRDYSSTRTSNQNPQSKTTQSKNLVQKTNNQRSDIQSHSNTAIQQQQKRHFKEKKIIYMSEFDSLDDCNEAMYQLSLEENIHEFQKMLEKVKEKVCYPKQDESLEEFLEKIHQCMFGRS